MVSGHFSHEKYDRSAHARDIKMVGKPFTPEISLSAESFGSWSVTELCNSESCHAIVYACHDSKYSNWSKATHGLLSSCEAATAMAADALRYPLFSITAFDNQFLRFRFFYQFYKSLNNSEPLVFYFSTLAVL